MALTVPTAGVIAGRAPDQRAPNAQTGAAFAELGERMLRVGSALERERLDRAMGQARLATVEGLNRLRLEFEEIGDPDRIDAEFAPRAQALRDELLAGVPEAIRNDAGMAFDEMRERHAFGLGMEAVRLRQSQRRVVLGQLGDATVRAAAEADPETQAGILDQFAAEVGAAISRGDLTPEQGDALLRSRAQEADNTRALRLLDEDPESLIAALDAGDLPGLTGAEDRERLRQRATGLIERRASAAAGVRDTELNAQIADAIRLVVGGRQVAGLPALLAAIEAHPDPAALARADELRRALAFEAERPEFKTLPLAEQRAALEEERARPLANPDEMRFAEEMEAIVRQAEEAWRERPFAQAREVLGLNVPPTPDPAADDALFARQLRDRAVWARQLAERGYTDEPRLFDAEERAAFAAMADASADPVQRERLATLLVASLSFEGAPVTPMQAAREIGADDVFVHVGGLVAAGGNRDTARMVFQGQRDIDEGNKRMPSETEFRGAYFDRFATLFADMGWEADTAVRNATIDAARGLVAYRLTRGDYSDPQRIDARMVEQAVHEVLGGTGGFGRSDSTGGIQEVNGALTLLPVGVRGRDVERGLRRLDGAMSRFRENLDFTANLPDAADRQPAADVWARVSVTGKPPRVAGLPLTATTESRLHLLPVGEREYQLIVEVPSLSEIREFQRLTLTDEDGEPFLIDLDRLLELGR